MKLFQQTLIKLFFAGILLLIRLTSNGQDIALPTGFKVLDQKDGDLTKDGIAEKVIVFDTNDSAESGTVRVIHIYKKAGNKWTLLVSSKSAVGESESGGMMGDPFESIEIKDNILFINQSGGSSWKWFKTDKYRFQNGTFQLIGYTNNYGKPCQYFENVDFNLLTGKIVYEKEYENCEEGDQKIVKKQNETFYKKGIKIDMANRATEIKIITPKYKNEIYL
jgi:hypothetical protein